MSSYTLSRTLELPYDATVTQVRERLADQGFGVLTEIDVRATMKNKLDVDVPAQVILGACRPQLAHRAMSITPSLAALLPCNVVVREVAPGSTVVEMIDPDTMVQLEDHPDLRAVATEARERLVAALDALEPS